MPPVSSLSLPPSVTEGKPKDGIGVLQKQRSHIRLSVASWPKRSPTIFVASAHHFWLRSNPR